MKKNPSFSTRIVNFLKKNGDDECFDRLSSIEGRYQNPF